MMWQKIEMRRGGGVEDLADLATEANSEEFSKHSEALAQAHQELVQGGGVHSGGRFGISASHFAVILADRFLGPMHHDLIASPDYSNDEERIEAMLQTGRYGIPSKSLSTLRFVLENVGSEDSPYNLREFVFSNITSPSTHKTKVTEILLRDASHFLRQTLTKEISKALGQQIGGILHSISPPGFAFAMNHATPSSLISIPAIALALDYLVEVQALGIEIGSMEQRVTVAMPGEEEDRVVVFQVGLRSTIRMIKILLYLSEGVPISEQTLIANRPGRRFQPFHDSQSLPSPDLRLVRNRDFDSYWEPEQVAHPLVHQLTQLYGDSRHLGKEIGEMLEPLGAPPGFEHVMSFATPLSLINDSAIAAALEYVEQGQAIDENTSQLFLRTFRGQTIAIEVPLWLDVEDLKKMVYLIEGLAPPEFRLIFRGRQIGNGMSLRDCGIRSHSTIELRPC